MLELRRWMDETARSAASDHQRGSGSLTPGTVASADRVVTAVRLFNDAELIDLVGAWRTAIETLPWAAQTAAAGAAVPQALGDRTLQVNRRLAALMEQVDDAEHEDIEAHPVRVVRIDDEDLVLQDALIEVNRSRGFTTWSWRLDGVLALPLPASLRSGRLCDLWAPIGEAGAFTGRGLLTITDTATGDDLTRHRLFFDGLEYKIV